MIASPDDSNKTIYGLPSVSAEIEQNYFNWKAWPNMLDRGQQPQLKKYHLEDLKPGETKDLAGTRMTVTPFPLNHAGSRVHRLPDRKRRRCHPVLRGYWT